MNLRRVLWTVLLPALASVGLGAYAANSVGVSAPGTVAHPGRSDREVGYVFHYPNGYSGAAHVILTSHGGNGSSNGEVRALRHLGSVFAEQGFVSVNLGHRPSANNLVHRTDRAADVTVILDALERGAIAPPADFGGRLVLDRVGHLGHSWGAFTANVVGGAMIDQGRFRDPRIAAIVPLSPQGPDQFGFFDRGPEDNSWRSVDVPSYAMIGTVEMDGPPSSFRMTGWRAQGFERYPADGARFLTVIEGQDHAHMGNAGTPRVQAFVAQNAALFFDVYLRGAAIDPCRIGTLASIPEARTQRKLPDGVQAVDASCGTSSVRGPEHRERVDTSDKTTGHST